MNAAKNSEEGQKIGKEGWKKEEKNGRKAEKNGDGQRLKKGRENNRSEEKVREVQRMSEKARESWADGIEQQRRGVEMKEEEGQRIRKKEKVREG